MKRKTPLNLLQFFSIVKVMSFLVGKTITEVIKARHPYCDDEGYLIMRFSDGSECTIVAGYGGFTGQSREEYPTTISIHEGKYLCDDSGIGPAHQPLAPLVPTGSAPEVFRSTGPSIREFPPRQMAIMP